MIPGNQKDTKPVKPVKMVLKVLVVAFGIAAIIAVIAITNCSSDDSADVPTVDFASADIIEATRIELQAALDSWRLDERITGASMSVYSPSLGHIDLASGLAKRSIDPDRFPDTQLAADRPMFAADIAHTLVAATVVQLAQEGTLDLSQNIDEWFPNIENADQITIRNLLEHTSGIPVFYTEDFLDVLYEQQPNVAQIPDDVIAVAAAKSGRSGGSYFAPGTAYGYSKTNYLVLGRIIELVAGNPLEQELRERLFEPLNLQNTYLAGRETVPGGIPLGYEYAGPGTDAPTAVDGHVPQTPALSVISAEWASGALVSTSADLIKLVLAIFEKSEFLPVANEILKAAAHPAQETESTRVDSGAGVFTWTENGQKVIGQFGFIYPFSAQFTYWPNSGSSSGAGTVITVIANEVDSSRNPNSNFQLPVIENLTKRAKNILDAAGKGE